MHERSLVATILKQVERIAREQRALRIRTIRLQVGELAGVEPILVQSAFDELKAETISPDCVLMIEHVPLTARCRDCERVVILKELRFQCPCCHSTSLDIVEGDTVRLASIEIEEESIPE